MRWPQENCLLSGTSAASMTHLANHESEKAGEVWMATRPPPIPSDIPPVPAIVVFSEFMSKAQRADVDSPAGEVIL